MNEYQVRKWLDSVGAVEYPVPVTQGQKVCTCFGLEDDCTTCDGEGYVNTEQEVTNCEAVIGLAAKRCYMSFEPGLNPNVTRVRKDWTIYLDNILKSGHGCYDSETEVLTSEGWKYWTDVESTDKLATLNPKTNVITYCQPKRLIRYKHQGMMYRIQGKVDLFVTPDHKMLACETSTKKEKFELWPAYVLGNTSYACRKDGVWTSEEKFERISRKYLWLLGFYIGAGTHKSGTKIEFHLRKLRKINKLLELFPQTNIKEDRYTVEIAERYWEMFSQSEGRIIPQNLLLDCSKQELKYLYQGLIDSDGSIDKSGSIVFDTTNKQLAGQFQQLLLHIGKAGNIYSNRINSFGDKPIYRVNITNNLKPEINRTTRTHSDWIENWEGEVFCAEVPNNTLYVRRGGKPIWCGNSVLEHCTYTFAIEGLTRVCTAELNRHRAGAAISEGSMRYIRFDDIGFWMPLLFREESSDSEELANKKRITRSEFLEAFEEDEKRYQRLCNLWNIDSGKFKRKKLLTSAFRRIVGMGVSTGGVWTWNMRALRHILEMRSTPYAEEEICYLAGLIGKLMLETEEKLFGDFELENGFYVPKYSKV